MKIKTYVRIALSFVATLWMATASHFLVAQTPAYDRTYFKQILTAFSQAYGKNPLLQSKRVYGNCDAIATIKTAMGTYGIDHVLIEPSSLPESNSSSEYKIVLRDGQHLSLTQSEVDTAINNPRLNSGFLLPERGGGDSKITFKANFLYSVMAKNMLNHQDLSLYKDVKNYELALTRLGQGINVSSGATDQIGILLGLKLNPATKEDVSTGVPYVYALRRHVVFAYGNTGDLDGTEATLKEVLSAHSSAITRHRGANANPEIYTINTSSK